MSTPAQPAMQVKPAPGFAAVELLTEVPIKHDEKPPLLDAHRRVLSRHFPDRAEEIEQQIDVLTELREGIAVGQIVELGKPMPTEPDLPYEVDDYAFFPESRGIKIWERVLVLYSGLIGYWRPDDTTPARTEFLR